MTLPHAPEIDVSVVVPCYDEEVTIWDMLTDLVAVLRASDLSWEVLVVDDGSRDRSARLVEDFRASEQQVRLVRHRINEGSGQAIWTGIQHAVGEFVIYAPADGQFNLGEIPSFVERARQGADIVISHRLSRDDYTLYRRASSAVFLGLCNTLFRHDFKDVNWVHLWRREIFEEFEVRSRGVFFLEEILVRALDAGKAVAEVPSEYHPRKGGQAKGGRPSVILKTIGEMLALWRERSWSATRTSQADDN